mmetsp:Transcript_6978/g.15055  ORF Transcript_6978/g.15055 Transcript_6978/m.15055 type:complete len:231 (+) Transcript_6978:54-746(+)
MIAAPFSSSTANAASTRAPTISPLLPSCFVYGTLMSPEVLTCLIGRVPSMLHNVQLKNHSRHPVNGCVYPGVIPRNSSSVQGTTPLKSGATGIKMQSTGLIVEGVLLLDISPTELKYLDYFEEEGVDYTRTLVEVDVPYTNQNKRLLQSSNLLMQTPLSSSAEATTTSLLNSYLQVQTNAYIWARPHIDLDMSKSWHYDTFRREYLASYLENTVTPCRIEFEQMDKKGNE